MIKNTYNRFIFSARMYDPQTARWNSSDPVQQYSSPYVYCGNDPVNKIDPTGMYSFDENDPYLGSAKIVGYAPLNKYINPNAFAGFISDLNRYGPGFYSDFRIEIRNYSMLDQKPYSETPGPVNTYQYQNYQIIPYPIAPLPPSALANNVDGSIIDGGIDGVPTLNGTISGEMLNLNIGTANLGGSDLVGIYNAYYGAGGKIGFDLGGTKAYAGIHLFTVQRSLNHRGTETKQYYSGLEFGYGVINAGAFYNWRSNEFYFNAGLGPINWTTGEPLNFKVGGDFYILVGAGLELNGDINMSVDKDSYGYTIPSVLCFIEGTKVLMHNGEHKNIEEINLGDSVLTYNFKTKSVEKKPVLRIDSPIHNDLVKIKFSKGISNTNTQDHPYFVIKKGWCSYNPNLSTERYKLNVQSLEKGDKCFYLNNGKFSKIKIKDIQILNNEVKTYNLTGIEGSNNYFVNGILVNNENSEQNIKK